MGQRNQGAAPPTEASPMRIEGTIMAKIAWDKVGYYEVNEDPEGRRA